MVLLFFYKRFCYLSIEFFFIGFYVYIVFELSVGGVNFEVDNVGFDLFVEFFDVGYVYVLEGVFEIGSEVGDEFVDGVMVGNGIRDILSNKDGVVFGEVVGSVSIVFLVVFVIIISFFVLYGVDGIYVVVGFDEFIFVGDEGSIGRFGGISKEIVYYDGGGIKGNVFDNMVNILDIIVGNVGNIEFGGESSNIVDGGSLGMIDGYDFLGDVGRVGVYINMEIVDIGGDESSSLFMGDNVVINDFEVRVFVFDLFDYFDLVYWVILRWV